MLALLLVAFALAGCQAAELEGANRKLLQGNSVNGALNVLGQIANGGSDAAGAGVDALLTAVTQGGSNGKRKAAQSLVDTSDDPAKLARLLRGSAKKAGKDKKKRKDVADTQAQALLAAKNNGKISDFAPALAQSLDGSPEATQITADAISSAAASGPNGQQATADAAASVYCDKTQGALSPSAAAAWGVSYAIAISQDPKTGCITLSKAFSSANAFCGPSGAKAITQDSAIVQQLGKCVSVPGFQIPSFALSGGTSGVVNTPGAGGSASAGGSANAPGGSSALRGCASNDVNCLLAQFGNARG
jgi:hypothetical protein